MDDSDAEILNEFIVESRENLDKLDSDFVALERDPSQRDRLADIFRTVHTIKGASGFLGFSRLEAMTHAGENLLSRLRDGALELTPAMTTTLLDLIDTIRHTLAVAEHSGLEPEDDATPLIQALHAHASGGGAPTLNAPALPASVVPAGAAPDAAPAPLAEAPADTPAPAVTPSLPPTPEGAPPDGTWMGQERRSDARRVTDERIADLAGTSVRVDVALLDKLLNLVGELVLTRNQVLQYGAHANDTAFVAVTQRLNLLTSELQEGVMKTRMRPIDSVWSKLPRLVRDVALVCGKEVALDTDGNETELDRTIIEAINDPLVHLVRNAIDHGIETPEVRVARGKPAQGRLSLRAFHEGGQVHLEVSDDGAGVEAEAVRRKAIERGVVTAEAAAGMSERDLISLIFQPGFSTSKEITNVSGRGVGLDVVRTNIERIGGTVDLQSQSGAGTTIRVKIPLTLAIIPVLLVDCRGRRFAIPQANVVELVRLEGEQRSSAIETIQGAAVYRLRGNLLPLIDLGTLLGIRTGGAGRENADHQATQDADYIVVLQADSRPFGLVVDGVSDTEEIVVKSLDKALKRLGAYGGATILGDGSVALILDVAGVARRAGVTTGAHTGLADTISETAGRDDDRDAMLLVGVGEHRLAVPLAQVARLEEIERDLVERAGLSDVVQYRGQILPLINLGEVLGGARAGGDTTKPLQVVVYTEETGSVGFVVDQILDVVEEPLTVTYRSVRRGVLGSVVLQGRVTELLDVRGAIRAVNPGFFEEELVSR